MQTSDLFSVACESFHKATGQNGSTSYALPNFVDEYILKIVVPLAFFYSTDDAIDRYLLIFTF